MPSRLPIFETVLKRRGRGWRWCVCTTEGKAVMLGSEGSRAAARYEANKALFLLLLSAPFRQRFSAGTPPPENPPDAWTVAPKRRTSYSPAFRSGDRSNAHESGKFGSRGIRQS